MQTPIVNETSPRRSIAEPDDFGLDLAPRELATSEPERERPAPAWDSTLVPRRSIA